MSETLLIKIAADIKDLKSSLDKATNYLDKFQKDNIKNSKELQKNAFNVNRAFEIAFGVSNLDVNFDLIFPFS